MREFLTDTFTSGLFAGTGLLLTILFGVAALFLEAGQNNAIKALSLSILFLLYVVVVLGIRAYQFYMTYARRIKVIRQVKGEGARTGRSFIAIQNPGFLRDNLLLTLYSPASGADQSICVLQIDKALPGQDILVRPFPKTAENRDLSQYFDADNKTRLYVNPLIHVDDLAAMLQGTRVGEPSAFDEEIIETENG
jgi:hypothetical protein